MKKIMKPCFQKLNHKKKEMFTFLEDLFGHLASKVDQIWAASVSCQKKRISSSKT